MPLDVSAYPTLPHRSGRPRIAGISGGASSGMMAALLAPGAVLAFQNTAREAPRTYEFLDELAGALGRRRPIVWLEYRPPKKRGDRPCMSRFAVVDSKTADRSGGPFEMLMEAINAFRASKSKGPIAPWFRSRLCTAYLKTRVARSYVASLGWTEWDEIVGLRADEPDRVAVSGRACQDGSGGWRRWQTPESPRPTSIASGNASRSRCACRRSWGIAPAAS